MEALTRTVAELLQAAAGRAQLGVAGRALVLARYRPERVWAALADEYRTLLPRG